MGRRDQRVVEQLHEVGELFVLEVALFDGFHPLFVFVEELRGVEARRQRRRFCVEDQAEERAFLAGG